VVEGDELGAIWQEQRQDMGPIAGTLSEYGKHDFHNDDARAEQALPGLGGNPDPGIGSRG
jgi:hypothetical protein